MIPFHKRTCRVETYNEGYHFSVKSVLRKLNMEVEDKVTTHTPDSCSEFKSHTLLFPSSILHWVSTRKLTELLGSFPFNRKSWFYNETSSVSVKGLKCRVTSVDL